MSNQFEQMWQTYTSAWKADTAEEKRSLFSECLQADVLYTDPLTPPLGADALLEYMLQFHQQVPGGHFVTTGFQHHHHVSLAQWNMCDGEGNVVGMGCSVGEYGDDGKICKATGFFDLPTG